MLVANAVGGETLTLPHRCTYRLTSAFNGDDGLPLISTNVTINGRGSRIVRTSTAPPFRIFEVVAGGTLTLRSLTIAGGRAPDGSNGPGEDGGGILNAGTLTLSRVRLVHNVAGTGGISGLGDKGGDGGAIENTGTLVASRVTIAGNHAGAGNSSLLPGSGGNGGGIASSGPLTISRSAIVHNFAGSAGSGGGGGPGADGGNGGGLEIYAGPASIVRTTIARNRAGRASSGVAISGVPGSGGGIRSGSDSVITPRRTRIVDNKPDNCAPPGAVARCRH
jgi:hypothetical protein